MIDNKQNKDILEYQYYNIILSNERDILQVTTYRWKYEWDGIINYS